MVTSDAGRLSSPDARSVGPARSRVRARVIRALQLTLAAVLLAYTVAPMLWLLISSFQQRSQLFTRPPTWLPTSLYLDNYLAILADPTLGAAMVNSFLVAVFTTLLALVLGAPAAYAFARLRVPARGALFVGVLASQMLPSMALLIPVFVVLRSLGLLYSHAGLILAYLSFTLPYVVWLLRAFFYTIPPELEEAARTDGCSRLQTVRLIVVPLSGPGLVSTGIFAFVGAWNEFLFASVMTNNASKTFPVRLAQFIGEEWTAYDQMFAAGILGSLPVVILVLLFQRFIVRGLTEGSLKG